MPDREHQPGNVPTILVTGSGGLIGGHLLTILTRAGYPVIGTYRRTVPAGDWPAENPPVLARWDLLDPPPEMPRADIIVHASAHTHLIADSTARDYVYSNLVGTIGLMEYARRQNIRLFVYLSTMSVYGEIDAAVVDAETPLSRPRLYGATKYTGELIVQEYARAFPALCLRLPGVVAPNYFTPWIGRVLKTVLDDEPIEIYNPDSPFNNIVNVGEIVRLVAHLTRHPLTDNLVVPLAASEPIPIRSVVDLMIRLSGSRSPVIEKSSGKASFVVDTRLLRDRTGFQPTTTAAAVEAYVAENLPHETRAARSQVIS